MGVKAELQKAVKEAQKQQKAVVHAQKGGGKAVDSSRGAPLSVKGAFLMNDKKKKLCPGRGRSPQRSKTKTLEHCVSQTCGVRTYSQWENAKHIHATYNNTSVKGLSTEMGESLEQRKKKNKA